MNMNTRIALTAAALAFFLGHGPAAMAEPASEQTLKGAWTHHVTPGPDAPPNTAEIYTFVTYAAGGVTVEQNGAPGGFGPSVGQWSSAGNSIFNATWLKPIYDPQSGQLVVLVKIRARIRMLSDDE